MSSQNELNRLEDSKKLGRDFRLTIFSLTWAIATLFHYQAFHKWTEGPIVWLAAVWLLMNPSQMYRLGLLAIFQVAEAALHLPLKHNHWLITTIINLTILLSMFILSFTRKSFRLKQTELYETFAPYIRLELIILYFYAVFHKLNEDFFNPIISCGSYFYQTQATRFAFLPDSQILEIVSMGSTLFFEICIPLLLIIPARRNLGVLVALVFHGIIGFNPTSEFWNFSALVYAVLVLFAPTDFSTKCLDIFSGFQGSLRNLSHKMHLPVSFKRYGASIAWSVFLIGIAVLVLIDDKLFEVRSGLVLWTIYMIVMIVVFIMSIGWRRILKEDGAHKEAKFNFRSYLLFLMPLIMFLNGTSPYLGLKTESSFAMFSNLRTEGGVSNHYIIPSSWQVFDFQNDLVEIVESSDQYLSSLANKELLLPYFEFKKYLRDNPETSVSYIRGEKTYSLKSIKDNPELLERDPWYYRAFLVFRPVSKKTPTPCTR